MATTAMTSDRVGPLTRLVAHTPSDTVDLVETARALYVGASGNVAVVVATGATPVTLVGLTAGVWHPIRFIRVNATNTTATGIVAGY